MLTIFSLGNEDPFSVAITLRALIIPEKLVISTWALSVSFFKRFARFCPSSRPIQTAGMEINLPVTEAVPVSNTPSGTVL